MAPVEEDDALEAFMAEIEQDVKQAEAGTEKKPSTVTACDVDDGMDDYIQAHAARNERAAAGGLQSVVEADTLDADDEDTQVDAHREIKPLEDVDHSKISYEAFKKDFYDESPDVFALDDDEIREQQSQLQISALGREVPKLVTSFEQCSFPAKLMSAIKTAGYIKPTAVQSQVLPVRSHISVPAATRHSCKRLLADRTVVLTITPLRPSEGGYIGGYIGTWWCG